jgi:predicted Zn-dependent protease
MFESCRSNNQGRLICATEGNAKSEPGYRLIKTATYKTQSKTVAVLLRGAALAGLALALSACQVLSVAGTAPGAGNDVPADELAVTLNPSSEPVTVDTVARGDRFSKLAAAQHPKILATYGGEYSDVKLERMVAKVVGRLTFDGNDPNQTYRITILNSPSVNAFALPGGFVYVTRGLLALANDSSELGAVIAHEMAHVTAKHGVQRQQLEAETNLASRVVSEVLTDDASGASGRQAAIRGKLKLAQFSRNQELEADGIGIKASGKSGYDPFAASRFLTSLGAYTDFRAASSDNDITLDFLATHPAAPQRVELAKRHARQFGAPDSVGVTERDAYLAGIDGMLFGDSPDEGFVRGQDFLHPALGIAYRLPPGFETENNKDAVLSSGPNEVAIRFDGVELLQSVDLAKYMRSGWVAGLNDSSVTPTTINGYQAVTAKAQADKWQFNITVLRVNGKVYRFLFAAPLAATGLDAVASSVSQSFKALSEAERTSIKPTRVRIVTVKSGDTVGSLANQMIGVDRKQELFRILNGLSIGQSVSAGSKVKVITDK